MMDSLEVLQGRLGHWFTDPEPLARALTHRSYANEHD
ncbi:MAG: dsRNA-specific ribonuclease, partial [Myxococcota bacterium]